jgi:tetratricopeptide (TPR) repeat protein
MRPGLDSQAIVARFEAERQTLARMDHPHIARVVDGGMTDDGRPFFVMELVDGKPVTAYSHEKKLPLSARLNVFISICQAVQHAHQKGIIHRDLKPSNVLVAEYDGKPIAKIIDFGIARAVDRRTTLQTEAGMLVGTPEYMSPEQADPTGQDIDTRSDVYSLGVIVFELLTGETPLAQRPPLTPVYEVLRLIREVDSPAPSQRIPNPPREPGITANDVRGELDWITLKCLEKDRDRRYQTAEALAEDVQRYLDQQPVMAGPPSRIYRLRKFIQRNRGAVLAASLLLAALAAGIAATTWAMFKARAAEQTAATERDIAQAVRAFFQDDLLAQTDAFRQQRDGFSPNPNLTLREALDRAAERIPGKFDRHPLVEAGIRQTIGDAYSDIGVSASAEPHLLKAREIYRDELGADHPRSIGALRSLAKLRHHQGRNDEAKDLYADALDACRQTHGPDDLVTLDVMNQLAQVQMNRSDLVDAAAILTEARARAEGSLGPDHDTARVSRGLEGLLHAWRGEWNEAEPLFREKYEYHRNVLGAKHLETLRAASGLGMVWLELARFAEAEQILDDAIKGLETLAGDKHLSTVQARTYRSRLLHRKGDQVRAEKALRHSVEETRTVLGPDHRVTLSAQFSLAVLFSDLRRINESTGLFRETLNAQRRVLGDSHFETLLTISSYAAVCANSGRLEEAEPLLLESLEGKRKLLGANHPNTLQNQITLANFHAVRGNMDRATTTIADALERCRTHLPKDAEQTTSALRGMGLFVEQQGDLVRAEGLFRELADRQRPAGSETRGPYNNALHFLAQVLIKQRKFAEAEPFLREAIDGLTPTQKNVWFAPRLKSLLGMSLLGQDRYADAEPYLLEGYEGLVTHRARLQHGMKVYLPDTQAQIVQLYEKWGKTEAASEWRGKSASETEVAR